ncbi:MAG TPA: hypothetical protein VLG66_16625, partial [Alphaproteobacteria bacterium]|nr:hypothetical protein [Alphaproteobacteria bacterium]
KINRIPLGRLQLLVLDMLIHNRIAENATFEGLRVGLLQSAEAIRPGDGRLTLQLVNACNAVGIGPILSVKGPPAGADPVAVPAVVGQAPFIFIAPADQSMAEVGIMTGGAAQLRAGLRYFISCQIMNLGIGSSSTPSLVVGLVKQQGKAVQVLARLQANPSNPIVPGGSMRLGPVTLDTAALPAAGSCDLIVAAIDPANPLPPNLSNAGVHPLHFDIMRAMVSP